MRRRRIPLLKSCVPDKRTRLPRSAACFWPIPQSFPARGCWTSTTGPTSSAWWFRRVKPRGSPISANSSNRPRPRDWCSRRSSAPACPDTRWHPQRQTEIHSMLLEARQLFAAVVRALDSCPLGSDPIILRCRQPLQELSNRDTSEFPTSIDMENALHAPRRGSPRPSPAARVGGIARGDSLEISDRLALPRSLQREDRALRVLAPDHATAARHIDRSFDDAAASSLHALRRRVNVAGVEIE